MLYVLYGSDTARSRAKLQTLIEQLLAKRPDAPLVRIDSDTYDTHFIEAQIGGQGLFAPRSIVILDCVLKKAEAREHLTGLVPDIAQSENVFVCLDETLDAPTLKTLQQHATKIEEHTRAERAADTGTLVFSVTDALAARSRGRAWVAYMKARRAGLSAEEIHHRVFWQVKNMLIAKTAASAVEAGMKEFPFKKAREGARKWETDELRDTLRTLITQNHEDRRGTMDLDLSFERLLLSI